MKEMNLLFFVVLIIGALGLFDMSDPDSSLSDRAYYIILTVLKIIFVAYVIISMANTL